MAKKRKNQGKGGGKPDKDGIEQPRQPTRSSNRKRTQRKQHSNAAADDYKLRNMVEADGLTIVDMNADGNCLFRALSDQLYRDLGNRHDEVRSDICDFIDDNQDDFQVFLVFDDEEEEGEDGKDFESYMCKMRQDGEWGGNLELVAAARLYRRKITVFSATLAAFTIDHDGPEATGPDMLVSFHDNDHYNSVRDESVPPTPPPTRKKSKSQRKEDRSKEIGMYAECIETPEKIVSPCAVTKDAKSQVDDSLSELRVEDKGKSEQGKPPKKNASCPCGSGLKYKKCCLAREKHAKRVAAMQDKAAKDLKDVENCDAQKEIEMKGNFRVLQI